VSSWQDFPAGTPVDLACQDLDGDGLPELLVTVEEVPQVVTLRATGGQLVESERIDLTLPATCLHVTNLFDGTVGLFTANRERGLVDFFQFRQGAWARLDSYYPGCLPLGVTSGDFNGDGGRDIASLGGEAELVTVMFANPEPGFWGYPALTLSASPGASALGDFDGDGLADLMVSNSIQSGLSFFPGQSDGGFALIPVDIALPFYPGPLAAIETDDDSRLELAVLDGPGDQVVIADYVPGQGFSLAGQTATGDSPNFVGVRDLDDDGRDDLMIITRETDEVEVLFGAGNHSFPARTSLGLTHGADWIEPIDLDADGLPDLVLSDGVNRVWTTLNQGDRSFGPLDWLNAGSGAGIMASGDLDEDQDLDLVVVNNSDETLSMFENTGTGVLVRRIGAHTLSSAPKGLFIQDLNGDRLPELVMNFREERVLGISFPLDAWEYSQANKFSGGPDVIVFDVADLNSDEVPDILTLDRSLMLGLTLLNVEQSLVAVHPEALIVSCSPRFLELRIRPDRAGPWRVEHFAGGRWSLLADTGQAVLGELDYDGGTWILTVERKELTAASGAGLLRLTVGEGVDRESLDISLAGLCPAAAAETVPLLAWAREPWPNPFNPLVNARFTLSRGAVVEAGIFDLAGRKIATLADGWHPAGDHALHWNGKQGSRPAGAGVYLLRISTPENILLHKVMLLK
jgi:hypothetical protein